MHLRYTSITVLKLDHEVRRRYPEMDNQNIRTILAVFTSTHNQLILLLDPLMNDNKWVTHIPYVFRHQIRQLSYFRMIHSSDLVFRESTRTNRRTLREHFQNLYLERWTSVDTRCRKVVVLNCEVLYYL